MQVIKKNGPGINVGQTERWASVIGGGALVAYGLQKMSWSGAALAAIGGAAMYRGASGHCEVYHALGYNTRNRQRSESVPYELGVRVDQTITINKTPEELYRFWRNFENLPKFMQHLDCVEVKDNRTSHWQAKAPLGSSVTWDAEVINEIENKLIAWRSLPGSQVDNAGSVRFSQSPNGRGTEVRISLQYNPPAGYVGAIIAKLFGQEPNQQIREDLRRFKQLMETGEISTTKGQSSGREATKKEVKPTGKLWNRDEVTSASEESFPASDPPSWTPETLSAT